MEASLQDLIARLRRDPQDTAALGQLAGYYRRQSDHASLANLLEGWASRAHSSRAAAEAYVEAGRLAAEALHDPERAVTLFQQALGREVHCAEAIEQLERLLPMFGEHRRLLELLEDYARGLEGLGAAAQQRAGVHYRIAELWNRDLGNAERAIPHYRRAFELNPSCVEAISAAREIYQESGNFEAVAALLELESNSERDPLRKADLLRELARVRLQVLGDVDGATAALNAALAERPEDFYVKYDLAAAYLLRAEQVSAIEAQADRQRAADFLLQLAQNAPSEAAIGYLAAALDAVPDHQDALDAFDTHARAMGREDMLPSRWIAFLQASPESTIGPYIRHQLASAYAQVGQIEDAITCLEPLLVESDAEAARLLADLYERAGRPQDVPYAWMIAARAMPPGAERARQLRHVMERASSNQEQAALAVEAAQALLEADPGDPEAVAFLDQHYRRENDYSALRDVWLIAARAPNMPSDVRKRRLREVASLNECKLNDAEAAVANWRAIAALDPADVECYEALDRLLTRLEHAPELVEVLRSKLALTTETNSKIALLRRIARVERTECHNLDGAIEALRQLASHGVTDEDVLGPLTDALMEGGLPAEAVDVLRTRIEACTTPGERLALRRMLARVLREELERLGEAFEVWASVLDDQPGDTEALDQMQAIDEETGSYDRWIETMSYRLEVTPSGERGPRLLEMAEVADVRLGDYDRAAEYYRKALELLPGSEDALDGLCDLYDRADKSRELLIILREMAQNEADPLRRAEIFRRIALTLTNRIRNPQGAKEAWRLVLEDGGEDEQALRHLYMLSERTGDFEQLVDAARRLARAVESTKEKRDLLLEAAAVLAGTLERPAEARPLLEQVAAEIAPEDAEALDALAATCLALNDREGAAGALERLLAASRDHRAKRAEVAERLANLYERELDRPAQAVDALRSWIEADESAFEARHRLAGLLERLEEWDALVDALDRLAERVDDETNRGELVRKAAQVAYGALGNVDAAWERLAPLVTKGDDMAESALREMARQAKRGQDLGDLLIGLAHDADSPVAQVARYLDASRVFEEYLGDGPQALEALVCAVAVDPTNREVLDACDRIAQEAGNWERLVEAYDHGLRHVEGVEPKLDLLSRRARLIEARQGDLSSALDSVLRACSLAPEDLQYLSWAESLAPRVSRSDELMIVYDRCLGVATDIGAGVKVAVRAAASCLTLLQDADRARAYLAMVVESAGGRSQILEPLEEAVRDHGMGATEGDPPHLLVRLIEVYGTRSGTARAEEATELLRRASRLLVDSLGEVGQAFDALKLASEMAPANTDVLDELEAFCRSHDRLAELHAHFDKLIRETLESSTAAEILRRKVDLCENDLGNLEAAADACRHRQRLVPEDRLNWERLVSLLRRTERHQDLLVLLHETVERRTSSADRLELLTEIAKIWEHDLENRWEALEAWERVLGYEPESEEAQQAVGRLKPRRAEESSEGEPEEALGEVTGHEIIEHLDTAELEIQEEHEDIEVFIGLPEDEETQGTLSS